MSIVSAQKRITVRDLALKKKRGEKIVSLTAYYAYSAAIAEKYCDFLLVGDSLGMVVYGEANTLAVSLDMMVAHTRAVVKATQRALIVVDMPFASYEESPQQAFKNAAYLLQQTGCAAVKLEGGAHMQETVAFLTSRGIPVMGHVGLTPQAINVVGGFTVQGRKAEAWEQIEKDARAIEEAGDFALVLEGVVEPLAQKIAANMQIPVIGIGASVACDGQILVMEDMLGCNERVPKFVRKYACFAEEMEKAFERYAEDIKSGSFPALEETYTFQKA